MFPVSLEGKRNTRRPNSSSRASFPSSKATKLALAWFDLGDPTDSVIAFSLARELILLGRAPVIVGPRRRPEEKRFEVLEGIPVYRVGVPWLSAFPVLADAWTAWQLLGLHRAEKIQYWHCHVFGRSHRAWRWASFWGNWRACLTLHLVLSHYLPFLGGLSALRALLSRAESVTVVSRANLEELRSLLPEDADRVRVVYSYGADPSAARQGSGRRLAPGTFLCPARLAHYKGTDILLMAFAKLLDRGHEARLLLCGRDQMQGRAREFVHRLGLGDCVEFAGEVPRPELAGLMGQAAGVVLASRSDNFPIALLEAMSQGAAVAAAGAGGIPELIEHGVNGLLVPSGDASALAGAMERLLTDESLRLRLGRAAAERSAGFTWSAAARSYCELYDAA